MCKKAGKSTLIAALAIFHLLITPDAECIIVAAARDQAEIILRQALGFIRRSESLQAHMRGMRREIQSLDDGGRIRVIASDEDTADGVLPTLAIVDELHRHRTGDLYGVLRLGLGPRHGRMVTISTAGATLASPLGELRRKAYEMEGFTRDHRRRRSFVRSPNGAFAFLEWCLDPGDDPADMQLVKLVNPAPWRTVRTLSEEHDSPSMTPWQWLRFACGVWTEGEEPWVDPAKWDALTSTVELAEPFWLGVGLGHRADTAALVKMALHEGEVTVRAEMLTATSLPQVESRIRELAPAQIVYGSKLFARSADMLEAEGFSVIQYPLTPERLIPASGTLYGLVEEGKLHHDGDPELRAQVLAGRVKETETGWRFAQDPTLPRPIDALMALAIGAHVMLTSAPEPRAFAVAWT
jgi:phage terminase large subunit-like protein